jgi:uncharacterized membrane protein (UPF0136 family)
MALSTGQKLAAAMMVLYGLVALAGGVMGWVKAGSQASLIAGGGSGLILLACAYGVTRWPTGSLVVGMLVALALVGRFGKVLYEHASTLGDFLGTNAGLVGLVMIIGGLVVIAANALGLASNRSAAV